MFIGRIFSFYLISLVAKQSNNNKATEGYYITILYITSGIADIPKNAGQNGPSYYRHDDETAAIFRIGPQFIYSQCKNGREHNRHKETDADNRIHRNNAIGKDGYQAKQQINNSIPG